MVNDLKLAVKSLNYAYNLKVTVTVGMVVVLLCIMILIFGNPEAHFYFYGIYFLVVVGIFPVQLLYSLNASNMVQASSVRKRMQTSAPAALIFASMAAGYLVAALILGVRVLLRPQMGADAGRLLLSAVAFMVAIMLYTAIAYKYFIFATMCFVFTFVGLLNVGGSRVVGLFLSRLGGVEIPYLFAFLLGLAAIAAGAALNYLISLLVYKVPVSKKAQTASLRKEM